MVKLLQNVSNIARREANAQDCRYIHDHQGKEVCFSNAAVKDLGTYFKNENGKIPTYPAALWKVFSGLDRLKSSIYQSIAASLKQHTLHNLGVSIRTETYGFEVSSYT